MEPPNILTWNIGQEKAKTQKLSLSKPKPALGIQYRDGVLATISSTTRPTTILLLRMIH
jgi:hypothetical protein